MKQSIKITLFFAMAIMISRTTIAQQGFQLNLNYNTATPLAGFRDYINKSSFNGAQGSALYGITDHFRVGLQTSYNNFYQKYDRQVHKATDGSDVSTVLSNTLQTVPLLVKGEYSFVNRGFIKPFIGVGAGLDFIDYNQWLGEFGYNKHYTKAGFTGDAGLLVPFSINSNYGFRLSTSYNLMPFKSEGINYLNSWNVQAGLAIHLK